MLSNVFALLQHSLFWCLCMQAYQAQKTTTLLASGVERWARKFLFFPGLPPWWYLPGTGRVNWSKSCLRALWLSLKCCTQFIRLKLDSFGLKYQCCHISSIISESSLTECSERLERHMSELWQSQLWKS